MLLDGDETMVLWAALQTDVLKPMAMEAIQAGWVGLAGKGDPVGPKWVQE